MLTHLRIQSLAIIDELEVTFGPGLNVVTGETGAGKSILVAALQLVLGARGRPELVRTGAERAEVEALFDIRADPGAQARAESLGFEAGAELLIRRVIEAEGRSRAYVNGRLATNSQLVSLAAGLVDISSQHEHHSLVDPASHVGYLDAYAGIIDEVTGLATAWRAWKDVADQLDALLARVREDRGDLVRFQLGELERAALSPEEIAEASRLRHAGALGELCGRAEDRLYAGDGAVVTLLSRVATDLDAAARLDPGLDTLTEQVRAASTELEDAARTLGRYARSIRVDPARQAELDERLHEQKRLYRKFGDDLAAAAARLRAELTELDSAQERVNDLEATRARYRTEVERQARHLSDRRRGEARTLAVAITAELASLGMGEARVDVAIAEAGLGAGGVDRVEFLIATNRGEEPRPLRKVASGGELSRALLAVKRVLASMGPVGVYVFDEVDTGVGGTVADVIGAKLGEVAAHHQVVCITHLPQIASQGDRHFHVAKDVSGERTHSRIRRLEGDERVEEIARMLGGTRISETTRAAARELLGGRG